MYVWKLYKLSFFFLYTICVADEEGSQESPKIKLARKGKPLEPARSLDIIQKTSNLNNNSDANSNQSTDTSSDEMEISESHVTDKDIESKTEKEEPKTIDLKEFSSRKQFVRRIIRTDPNLGLAIPYYKIFVDELLKIIIKKDENSLVQLAGAFGAEVDKLVGNHVIVRFGKQFTVFFKKFGTIAKTVSAKILKGAARVGLKVWTEKQMQKDDIFELVQLLNNFITYKEGHEILQVIENISHYPENDKAANEIMRHMIQSILLDPIKKDDGTSNLIIAKINKCIQSFVGKLKTSKKKMILSLGTTTTSKSTTAKDEIKYIVVADRENELLKKSLRKHATKKKHPSRRRSKHHKRSRKHKHKKSKSILGKGKRYLRQYEKYMHNLKHKRKHKKHHRKKHKSRSTKKRRHRKKREKIRATKLNTEKSFEESEETSKESDKSSNRLTIEYESIEAMEEVATDKPPIQETVVPVVKHEKRTLIPNPLVDPTIKGPTTSTSLSSDKVKLRKGIMDYFTGQYVSATPISYQQRAISTYSTEQMQNENTDVAVGYDDVDNKANAMNEMEQMNNYDENPEEAVGFPKAEQISDRFKEIMKNYGGLR